METGTPFNDFKHPNDLKISDLMDESGDLTGFAIEVSHPFSGTLDRSLANDLGLPHSASSDMFFSDGIHIAQSGFLLTNLNRERKYTFVFYGAINDGGTETRYVVTGKNEEAATLVNDYNTSNVVVIRDIVPLDDATIAITMSAGPNNVQWARFFGINCMLILPEGSDIPIGADNN